MTLEPNTEPRWLSTCPRHPVEPVTGFCASCLRERLAFLDCSGHPEPSSSTTTTTAAAPESIILSASGGGGRANATRAFAVASSSPPPELRHSKSYSASKCGASSSLPMLRRRSCDVRARNTLWHLFNLDDEENGLNRVTKVESKDLGFLGVTGSVFESRGEDENGDKIRASGGDALGRNFIFDEQRFEEVEEELKTMKEHIELEWQSRKHTVRDFKDIAGSFWVAASVFSQKLRKLSLKQRMKKGHCGRRSCCAGIGGGVGLQLRETQSEVGEYGYGRRSCDTDPRFSVDAGQMSLDDPRFSFDEPRASWDGYMIARPIPRHTPMISVIENVIIPPMNRSENRKSIEEKMNSINKDETNSSGSSRTRDYCSDSTSMQRRNSFDCSSSCKDSNKKTVAVEVDEMKSKLNAKVSPTTIDIFHRMKFVVTNREMRDSNFNSLKYDHLESFESASNDVVSVAGGGNPNGFKKSGRWRKVWNILGFMHRLSDTQYGEVEKGHGISHTIIDCREKQNGEANGVLNRASSGGKLVRSSSCVGSRSYRMIGSYRKYREESALERNRSARYSLGNSDNGLWRFYLTPLWSCRRNKSGKRRLKNSHSIARSVLRLN